MAFVSESFNGETWTSTFKHPHSLRPLVENMSVDEFQLAISLAVTALDQMKQFGQSSQPSMIDMSGQPDLHIVIMVLLLSQLIQQIK